MHNDSKLRIVVLFALALFSGAFATGLTNAADTNVNDRNLFEEPTPDLGWPRILSGNGQSFTIYQPQLDSWDGFTLEAHAAVALATGADLPSIFGVVNLKVRTLVDKTDRLVSFEDLQVVDAKFPSAPEQEQAYTQALRDVLPKSIKSVSLDRLEAQLDIQAEQSKSEALPLQNAPPRIVFMQTPTVLVFIDGEPKYVPVEGTKLARVLNTRVLLLKDSKDKFYLHLLDGYMQASALTGPWSIAKKPPNMTVGMHLCRGNLKGAWMAEGGYDPIAEVLFNQVNVDGYFLEYDTDRAGDFKPLRFVPKGKTVILGLVSTKTPELEKKDELKRRIEEAAKHCPIDQLGLSPQCGFSSGGGSGQVVTEDDTRRKLALIVEVCREVWGTA